jgi:hypothetical protein
MARHQESHRVRCVSGKQAGMWLWTITVSKGRSPIEFIDWGEVLQRWNEFNFHPHFVPEVVAALTAPSRELAEGYVRVLALNGFDCEVVSD